MRIEFNDDEVKYIVTYNGVDYTINENEYLDLVNGYRTKKEMFN